MNLSPLRQLALLTSTSTLLIACSPESGRPAFGVDPPAVSTSAGDEGAARFVDVFIGTGDSDSPHAVPNGKGGSTFPGATVPFGMVQWSPDTPWAAPPGYLYDDSEIIGLSLTHLNGAGCMAQRDFPVMPVTATWDGSAEPIDTFTHDAEIASPGFYEVTLGSGIKVDLTATTRAGFARFTFPRAAGSKVLISGGWLGDSLMARDFEATIRADGVILGSRTDSFFCGTSPSHRVHFAARFDRPFASHGVFDGGALRAGESSIATPGTGSGVYLGFDTVERRVVHMKVGLSYTSQEAALENLDAEIPGDPAPPPPSAPKSYAPGWDFDAIHEAAIDRWNTYLNRVAIEGGTEDERRALYSALYHVFVQPAIASDVDGSYMGFDGAIAKAEGYTRYANFSGWDIYRSWIQLISVLAPEETGDMMRSLVASGAECGALPKWALASNDTGVMVGDPSDALLASAWAFGARGFDAKAALDLMLKGANDPGAKCGVFAARAGLAEHLALGYVPADTKESVWGPPATTLEYAIADFTIAQLAGALGDEATRATFLDRGRWWKNVFDPNREANGFMGYMQPRLAADEGGAPKFLPTNVGKNEGFVEGNAAQYTFMVPHDFPGLIAALGGDAAAIARLDDLFTQLNAGVDLPYFYMGNEPEFWTPWEYPFAGAPWRTQEVVRRVLLEAFRPTPGGLPGNDDLGALSSWQVWAMLGLYPAIPGVGGLVVGSPLFPKATIALAGGKTLVITGKGAGAGAPFVRGLAINGAPSTSTWIPWESVAGGASLDFELGSEADMSWGAAMADRPPSF